jgi:UDP-N-acetylmuramoylalanine--D-glutamate ligase
MEGVENAMGSHPHSALVNADRVVVSPGIPVASAPVQTALEAGVAVQSELGFAASLLEGNRSIIAITGTNGKSTVTWFTAGLLSGAGRSVFVGGNLGTPLSEAVDKEWEVAVVEVSSYQLELPGPFQPSVAVVLNLAPDHLERHGTMEVYAEHKCRLLHVLGEDGIGVLPSDDLLLSKMAAGHPGERLWLDDLPGVVVRGEVACFADGSVDLAGLSAPGALNRWNAAVACLLAHSVGVPLWKMKVPELRALPHRMEPVGDEAGVRWINDSKATNVDATARGLEGLDSPEGTLVVLLGGKGKAGSNYRQLKGTLREKARAVICFGDAGPEIAADLEALTPVCVAGLQEAVERARVLAQAGDTVVLSPACASFDEFNDFAERGDRFRQWAVPRASGRMG